MRVFREDLFQGQVALVTGGGSGIGAAIARALASHGAQVALTGRTEDKLLSVARSLPTPSLTFPADVRDPSAIDQLMAAIDQRFGRLDIVVNCAAGNFLSPAAQLSPNGFSAVVDIDLKGTFHTSKAAYPLLARQGGSLIQISATLQYLGTPLQAHAAAAKAGIDALTRSLAVEWGPAGIRVNAVAPGPIAGTEGMSRLASDDAEERLNRRIPLGRFGTAEEIADAVLFLASPASRWTTGAILVVDGGQWLTGPLVDAPR